MAAVDRVGAHPQGMEHDAFAAPQPLDQAVLAVIGSAGNRSSRSSCRRSACPGPWSGAGSPASARRRRGATTDVRLLRRDTAITAAPAGGRASRASSVSAATKADRRRLRHDGRAGAGGPRWIASVAPVSGIGAGRGGREGGIGRCSAMTRRSLASFASRCTPGQFGRAAAGRGVERRVAGRVVPDQQAPGQLPADDHARLAQGLQRLVVPVGIALQHAGGGGSRGKTAWVVRSGRCQTTSIPRDRIPGPPGIRQTGRGAGRSPPPAIRAPPRNSPGPPPSGPPATGPGAGGRCRRPSADRPLNPMPAIWSPNTALSACIGP